MHTINDLVYFILGGTVPGLVSLGPMPKWPPSGVTNRLSRAGACLLPVVGCFRHEAQKEGERLGRCQERDCA